MKQRIYLLFLVFLIVIGMESILFYNFIDRVEYFYEGRGISVAGFYLFATLSGCLAIALSLFLKSRLLFMFFFVIELFTYLITKIYQDINGYGFGLSELTVAFNEAGKFSEDVWSAYSVYLYHNLLVLILPMVLFVYLLRRFLKGHQEYYFPTFLIFLLFILTFSTSYIIVRKTTNGTNPSPMPVKMLNTVAYFILNRPYYGDRKKVELTPVKESSYENIIWIVDESVGGAYLSINGYEKETTPYLASIKDNYLNLGLASSAANCSAMSNILLMSGTQLRALPDNNFTTLKRPTIFQYAKQAGYTTHYISGQSKNNRLQNFMTAFDVEDIDDFFQPTGEYKSDETPEKNIIEKTSQALEKHKKNFIYIVKKGSHFHWEHTYPESHTIFKPTLSESESLTFDKKEKALNSYYNSIRYGVDVFFERFFKKTKLLDRENTVIIYTSDHGQSILENEKVVVTHCSASNPPLSQGVVPLLIFKKSNDKLFMESAFSKDIYSHYEIFPTTLEIMGYKTDEQTLFGKKKIKQEFYSGDIFGRASFMKTSID